MAAERPRDPTSELAAGDGRQIAERPRDPTSRRPASRLAVGGGRPTLQVAEPPVITRRELDLEAEEPTPPQTGFDWTWLAFLMIVLVGLGLRLFNLGARAMHHDESLHAVYSWYLYVG